MQILLGMTDEQQAEGDDPNAKRVKVREKAMAIH